MNANVIDKNSCKNPCNQNTTQDMQVSTLLYNKSLTEDPSIQDFKFLDSSCCCVGESAKKQCVYINLCLDKDLHAWLMSQGDNYHKTLNTLLAQAKEGSSASA